MPPLASRALPSLPLTHIPSPPPLPPAQLSGSQKFGADALASIDADRKRDREEPSPSSSQGPPTSLRQWRRHSVEIISNMIETAATVHQVTEGKLSLVGFTQTVGTNPRE